MNLLIVESPAKCKTIKGFLGDGYEVLASYGHLRDLSDKHFHGIDLKNNFQPHFKISNGKSKYIMALKNAMKFAKTVYIATDDDREGEAIGWHLTQILKLDPLTNPRIIFREITKKAVTEALQKPGVLNMNVVYSQQARQVLDKLVGYELCPLLWKHISSGLNLSAGRVQSVVTKIVIDRENEIKAFQSNSFFKVTGVFRALGVKEKPYQDQKILAELEKKLEGKEECQTILEKCLQAEFKINDLTTKDEFRNPKAPFITSTLQQEAGSRLGFSTKQTMMAAQKLYEKGFITYMRTDSTSISKDFQTEIKKYIEKTYSNGYVRLKDYKKKVKGSQDAHECIRPTKINRNWVGGDVPLAEKKLYRIIWQRTVASQMAPQKLEAMSIKIGIYTHSEKLNEEFKSRFEKELFPGYKVIYRSGIGTGDAIDGANEGANEGANDGANTSTTTSTNDQKLYDEFAKKLVVGQKLEHLEIIGVEKYTEPPARYSEATLVKTLENNGIGRPSTYASMVSKIQERNYVVKETREGKELEVLIMKIGSTVDTISAKEVKNGVAHFQDKWKSRTERSKLFPTDVGIIVTDFLTEHFDKIMNYEFTSKMEEKLDVVSHGDEIWYNTVKEYYDSFHPTVMLLEDAKTSGVLDGGSNKAKDKHTRLLGVDPKTGENIYVTIARHGPCLRLGDDPKKSDYFALGKGVSMMNLTLKEALSIMQYPKTLGEVDGVTIKVKNGPYGFYVEKGKERVSIPKETNPDSIDLEAAKKLVAEKGKQNYVLAKFEDSANNDEVIQILKGKFGPYIKKNGKNISLKGKTEEEIKALTLDEVKAIINEYIINGPKRGKKGKKTTTTAKKKTTSIKTSKKTTSANCGPKKIAKKIPKIAKKATIIKKK